MRKPRHIGVTGTRAGGSAEQLARLTDILDRVRGLGFAVLHHGDALGIDVQAHTIAHELGGYETVCHPPDKEKHRAFTQENACWHEPLPYLERNKRIVESVEVLLAFPAQDIEILRSGTWSTVRYARKRHVVCMIVKPSGLIRVEDNGQVLS